MSFQGSWFPNRGRDKEREKIPGPTADPKPEEKKKPMVEVWENAYICDGCGCIVGDEIVHRGQCTTKQWVTTYG